MIRTETVGCRHGDVALEGFARVPAGDGPFPAVLIVHGGLGLTHIVPRTADRLAQAGYLAVAADMLGGDVHHAGGDAIRAASAPFGRDPALARERIAAWIAAAMALPWAAPGPIAAIGYCFGGHCVLELARSGADVAAVASFHGILTSASPAVPDGVKAEVAVFTGSRDPYVPQDHVDAFRREFTAGGGRFAVTEYSHAMHGFTDPGADALGMAGMAYDAVADRASWDAMMAMLAVKLAPVGKERI